MAGFMPNKRRVMAAQRFFFRDPCKRGGLPPMRSNTMPFDIGFQKLDLIALLFNDVFDQVTHRNDTNHFMTFKYR